MKNHFTRRSFLQQSALAGIAATGGATLLPGISFPANAAEPGASDAPVPSLPFSMTIQKQPFPNMPDYFGGGPGNPYTWVDFPVCPVMIDGEYWVIYKNGDGPNVYRWKGANIEDAKRQPDGKAPFPQIKRPYFLGGMWYDESEKKLYAPMHCEYYEPKNVPMFERQMHLATSVDRGLTWHYEGPIVTRDKPEGPFPAASEYSGAYWHGGDGDFFIYVDEPNGYIYLFSASYWWTKKGLPQRGFVHHHVARCAIGDKMAPGKWQKFYNGRWDEPGLGGKASNVNAYYVMYNAFLKKYIGMTYGSGLAFCTDLAKQDWSPSFKIPGDPWGCNGIWAWHVTAADKKDVYRGDQTLYLYTYWKENNRQFPTTLYKIDFAPGVTAAAGFSPEGIFCATNVFMSPSALCPCEPILDSADPIESRRTRRIHSDSTELAYSGKWSDQGCGGCTVNVAKETATPRSAVELTFRGPDVYWRAIKGPDRGKADVFIDGRLDATVDCYAANGTVDQFAFVKTGLAAGATHMIKVVMRGDKNARSAGAMISHHSFEHAADSYRASDGCSSIQGKNGWRYREKNGPAVANLTYGEMAWVGKKRSAKDTPAEIGFSYMIPGDASAVRQWVAPHAGVVRIEGAAAIDPSLGNDVEVAILVNEKEAWPSQAASLSKKRFHDIKATVAEGDVIGFIAARPAGKPAGKVAWDPTITYVDS